MKRILIAAALAAATVATPVLAADVGVSISVGDPHFYGRLDIGDFPQPQVIYGQPMMIERGPMDRPPIYLRVPPGHAKHWRQHCREYNACGERVFFVMDNWYNRKYAPRYREQHRDRQDNRGNDRRDGRGNQGNDRHGDNRDHGHDRQGDNRDHDRNR